MTTRFIFHDSFESGNVEFESFRILSTNGDRIKVRFVTYDDKAVDVILTKSQVRDLVNWDMLL